jgi:hypothetical protein
MTSAGIFLVSIDYFSLKRVLIRGPLTFTILVTN